MTLFADVHCILCWLEAGPLERHEAALIATSSAYIPRHGVPPGVLCGRYCVPVCRLSASHRQAIGFMSRVV